MLPQCKKCSHYENQYDSSSEILNRITLRSSNSTSEYILKKIENKDSKRYLSTHVYSIINHNSQKWKQPKCSLRAEWDEHNVYMHNRIYYSALKSNDFLTHDSTWVNLENITRHKMTNTCIWFYLHAVPRVAKFTETESKVISKAWGWE